MSIKVKTCPIMEAIARKLSGIEQCPPRERGRMIARAVKAGKDTAKQIYGGFEMENDSLRAELEMAMAEQEQLLSEIAELKKLVEQMGDFYIEHKPHCEKAMFVNGQCSCGLEKIKAAISAAKGAKE